MDEAVTPNLDQSAIERRWRERGFSCDLWVDRPGQVWADFVHETDELVLVVRGQVAFEFCGVAHYPECGQELLIPARTSHTVRNVGGTQAEWLYGYKRARAHAGG